MPTEKWFEENPKISAYISQDLYGRLEEWMREQNIKKVSQALTTILENHLTPRQGSLLAQTTGDTERLEALEGK